MHIAYSCTGEGFGHAARMVVISKMLEPRHRVSYFVPKSVRPFLEEKLPGFSAEEIPYFAFAKRDGGVDPAGTIVENFPKAVDFAGTAGRISRRLQALGVDAVISDFDPYLAWAGRTAGIPVIQINHPGIIGKHVSADPRSWFPALGAVLMEGPWDDRIHISFYGGDAGPLFRPSLFRYPVHDGGYVLFNLKTSYRREISRVLERFPDLPIRIFPSQGENFEEALAGCRAVVSSAGHQIIAESIVLGKPLLVIPERGQREQLLNARMLEKTRAGVSSTLEDLPRSLPLFLRNIKDFEKAGRLPPGFTVKDGSEEVERRLGRFLHSCRSRKAVRRIRNRKKLDKAAAA